jgi:hypothetical protein
VNTFGFWLELNIDINGCFLKERIIIATNTKDNSPPNNIAYKSFFVFLSINKIL